MSRHPGLHVPPAPPDTWPGRPGSTVGWWALPTLLGALFLLPPKADLPSLCLDNSCLHSSHLDCGVTGASLPPVRLRCKVTHRDTCRVSASHDTWP